MSEQITTRPTEWERLINALLDGELKPGELAALRAEAALSPPLQQELSHAQALQEALCQLPGQEVPAGLQEKLRHIGQQDPQQQAAPLSWWRWGTVAAAISLLFFIGFPGQAPTPSASEIEQGRRDLAVALQYLDKAGRQAAREIDTSINGAVIGSIRDNTIQTLSSQLGTPEEVLL
jgi:anti-sigma factor RsiW